MKYWYSFTFDSWRVVEPMNIANKYWLCSCSWSCFSFFVSARGQPRVYCAVIISFPSSSTPQYQVEWIASPHPLAVPWLFGDCLAQGVTYCPQPLQFYTSEKETTQADFIATPKKAPSHQRASQRKEPTAVLTSARRVIYSRVRLSFHTISNLLWKAPTSTFWTVCFLLYYQTE